MQIYVVCLMVLDQFRKPKFQLNVDTQTSRKPYSRRTSIYSGVHKVLKTDSRRLAGLFFFRNCRMKPSLGQTIDNKFVPLDPGKSGLKSLKSSMRLGGNCFEDFVDSEYFR